MTGLLIALAVIVALILLVGGWLCVLAWIDYIRSN